MEFGTLATPAMVNMDMDVDERTAPDTGESRSSVRSCTTCSKAKAKCVRQPGQEVCQRCTRLRKECLSKEPVLRKRKTTKTSRAAQLEKLENKIEHLVNALSTQQAFGQPSPPQSQGGNDGRPSHRAEVLESLCANFSEKPPEEDDQMTRASPIAVNHRAAVSLNPMIGPPHPPRDTDDLGVTLSEAVGLLDRYRRLMAHSMPFVVIDPDSTAEQLYEKKPLLLHAIVVVTHFHDLPKQQRLMKGLMRDISERILMNNEKNVGILQGILVFVAWYHPHIFWGQQVTNLLHLAAAMVTDLQLDRTPGSCHSDFKSATTKAVHGNASLARIPTPDEARVLIGVYYMTSMLATSFRKIEAPTFTKYMEESLNNLERAREYDSDLLAVQMVRLEHFAEETSAASSPTAPMQMYVKAFEADLARLRQRDPCLDGVNNTYLQMQYLTAEILVWELSLTDLQENKTAPLRSHLDDLYRCIDAIKRFIDLYFSIPTDDYLLVPFSAFAQFAHAFIALTKLASLEIEGWDMKAVHQGFDFTKIVEEAAVRFEASMKSSPDGLQVNNESFGKWAHRVRWMKQVFENKFNPPGQADSTACLGSTGEQPRQEAVKMWLKPSETTASTPMTNAGAQQPTPPDDYLAGDFFNYLDDNFWTSIGGGDWDYSFPDTSAGAVMSPYPAL